MTHGSCPGGALTVRFVGAFRRPLMAGTRCLAAHQEAATRHAASQAAIPPGGRPDQHGPTEPYMTIANGLRNVSLVLDGPRHILDRHVRVDTKLVEQADTVGAQALQGRN